MAEEVARMIARYGNPMTLIHNGQEQALRGFHLTYTSANGTETYLQCTWTYQRRVWDASGIRQIRLGKANLMEIG